MEGPKIETKAVIDPALEEKKEKKATTVLRDINEFKTQVKSFKVSDLIVPVLSIIVLLLLSYFVYIPMIRNAVQFQSESKSINEKILKLNKLNSDLDGIDVGILQSDLSSARTVVPFSLQVSDFAFYVDDLAGKKGLEFMEIFAGDIAIRSKDQARDTDPTVKGVSGPLKYRGDLEDIISFLDELQSVSPFIVSSDNIQLRRAADSQLWEVSLAITGYYLNEKSIVTPDIYTGFAKYDTYRSILDIFENKADRIEGE